MFLVSSCSCLCAIHWDQVLSQEWRCSWSSADRWCSNYIWVIDNFVAYQDVSYIRDFTVTSFNVIQSCAILTWPTITCYCTALQGLVRYNINQGFVIITDTPYLTLMDEPWSAYCNDFGEIELCIMAPHCKLDVSLGNILSSCVQ